MQEFQLRISAVHAAHFKWCDLKVYINSFSFKDHKITQGFIPSMMNYAMNRDILSRNNAHQKKFQMDTFFSSTQFTLWYTALLTIGTINWTKLLQNFFFSNVVN